MVAVLLLALASAASLPTAEAGHAQLTLSISDAGVILEPETAASPPANAVFTVTLSGTFAGAHTVSYSWATVAGTATAGSDFTASSGSGSLPAGQTTAEIIVPILGDALDEPDESFTLTLTSPNTVTDASGTATIADEDPAPGVSLSASGSPVAEAAGTATITASLTAASGFDVTVTLGYSGSAGPGDYSAASGTITIPAGSLSGQTTITATQDALDEADETILVDITSVTNGQETGTQQATVIIADDDASPSVSLALDTATTTEAGGLATLTATLDAVSAQTVTVHLAHSGTAVRGTDYASETSIAIAPGATTGSITITATQDALDEADETVIIDVSSATNGNEATPQQVTLTILDDDPVPTVTLSLSAATIAESGGTATLTATLSAVSGRPVTIDLGLSGTAAANDYTLSQNPIMIPAGTLSADAVLTATSDASDEADETIVIDITSVTNGAESGTQQVVATILDDDAPPTVALGLSGSPFAENGGVATVTATLSAPSSLDVTVNFAFGGTATHGSDYTRSATSLVIPAGANSAALTLQGVDDALDEASESVQVDIASVTNGAESGTQQVIALIADDDPAPGVSIALTGSPLAEAGGTATLTATLDAVSAQDVTLTLDLTGTASATDYTATATTLTIPAGATTASLTLTATQDALDEADETIIIDVTGVTNGAETGTQGATATITDDDEPPTVTLSRGHASLAEAGATTTVTATLAAPSGRTITVELAFTGTATPDADYTRGSTTLTFAPGATTASTTLVAVQDALDEPDETILVDIATADHATEATPQQVVVTILDDDEPPTVTLSIAGSPAPENAGTITVTASLSAPSGRPVSIALDFTGTATSGADYTRSADTLLIPAGATTASLTLTAAQDALDEPDETIVIDISAVTNAMESGTQQATATITDDDAPPTVSLSVTGSPIAENAGTATVTATLSTASGRPVTIQIAFSGTASAADYAASASNLVIPAGSTSASLTLTATQDTLDEADETIVIDVSDVTNGLEDGTQQVTAQIADDDPAPTVTLTTDDPNLAEAPTTRSVTITLSAASGRDVSVQLGLMGTATLDLDYTHGPTTVIVPAGQTQTTFQVQTVQDALDEADETIVIDITSVTGATEDGVQRLILLIVDDDATPTVTLSIVGSPQAENGGVSTVTATLSAASGRDVTVVLALAGTALVGTDYSATATTLTIPAGSTQATLTLTAIQDALDEADETILVDLQSATHAVEATPQQAAALITDDDLAPTVTLSLSQTELAEAAGTTTLTATLSAASGCDVTVTLQFTGTATHPADYSRSATTLTIPAGATTATITLTAVQDALDETSESIVVDLHAATNAVEASPQRVTAQIQDDDAPTVTLTTSDSSASEPGTNQGQFTITRTAGDLSAPLTVTYTVGGTATAGADYTALSGTATILAGQTVATIQLTILDDALQESGETVTLTVAPDAAYVVGSPATASITITDDDSAGITVSPTSGLTTSEDGGTDTFAIVLNTIPTADVVVTVATSDAAEGTPSLTSLTFTPANALTPQTVTVRGVDDPDIDGPRTYTIRVLAATSLDPLYDGLDGDDVSVTNRDDDSAAATATPPSGLQVSEAGATASFTIVLQARPTATVTIPLSVDDATEAHVPASVVFTPTDWNVPQTVVVAGVDDGIVDGPMDFVVRLGPAVSDDPHYHGLDPADVTGTNLDNDVPGLTVLATGGSTRVSENRTTDGFTVRLNVQPLGDVRVVLSLSEAGEATLETTSLTFTPTNWDVPQTVTVHGLDDDLNDGDKVRTIRLAIDDAQSSDEYDAVADVTLDVTNEDNDAVHGLAATPGTLLMTPGASQTILIQATNATGAFVTPPSCTWTNETAAGALAGAADACSRTFTAGSERGVHFEILVSAGGKELRIPVRVGTAALAAPVPPSGASEQQTADLGAVGTTPVPVIPIAFTTTTDTRLDLLVIDLDAPAADVRVDVQVLTALPAGVPPPPSLATSVLLEIGATSAGSSLDPRAVTIRFTLLQTWLDANCPIATCAVRLFHWTGSSWEILVPTLVGETPLARTYEALATSLSPFAVGGASTVAASGGGGGGGGGGPATPAATATAAAPPPVAPTPDVPNTPAPPVETPTGVQPTESIELAGPNEAGPVAGQGAADLVNAVRTAGIIAACALIAVGLVVGGRTEFAKSGGRRLRRQARRLGGQVVLLGRSGRNRVTRSAHRVRGALDRVGARLRSTRSRRPSAGSHVAPTVFAARSRARTNLLLARNRVRYALGVAGSRIDASLARAARSVRHAGRQSARGVARVARATQRASTNASRGVARIARGSFSAARARSEKLRQDLGPRVARWNVGRRIAMENLKLRLARAITPAPPYLPVETATGPLETRPSTAPTVVAADEPEVPETPILEAVPALAPAPVETTLRPDDFVRELPEPAASPAETAPANQAPAPSAPTPPRFEPGPAPRPSAEARSFTTILRDVWDSVEAVNAKTLDAPLVPPSDRPLPARGGWAVRTDQARTGEAREPSEPINDMPPELLPSPTPSLQQALDELAAAIDRSWDNVEIVTPGRVKSRPRPDQTDPDGP